MKKVFVLGLAAAAVGMLSGCTWCSAPLASDPSCLTTEHKLVTTDQPYAASMVSPNIAISREVFRPVFRAGAGRLTVMGAGSDREDATYDAIAKFLEKTNCDYIVSVSTVTVKKTHPTPWWYFLLPKHNNYSVTLSGIPVYLEKLSCETLDAEKTEAYDAVAGQYLPARGYNSSPAKAKLTLAKLPIVAGVEETKAAETSLVPETPSFLSGLLPW